MAVENARYSGAYSMMPSVLRILTSGILAGTLIKTGSAEEIAEMIHAGATVVDSLPHGFFFHVTGSSVNMGIKERMALIPYEAYVGLTSTIVSAVLYLVGM